MECLCEQLAGPQMVLAPGCIGEIWIFKNLDRTEMLALSQMAVRRKISNKQSLFLQGDPASEMFLIKEKSSFFRVLLPEHAVPIIQAFLR